MRLLIQRDGQANGGGGEQVAEVLGALIVDGIVDVAHRKEYNDEYNGNQNGIQHGQLPLFPQKRANSVSQQTDEDSKIGRGAQKLIHRRQPPASFRGE